MTVILLAALTEDQHRLVAGAVGDSAEVTYLDTVEPGHAGALALARLEPTVVLLGTAFDTAGEGGAGDPFSEAGAERALEIARELEMIDPAVPIVLVTTPDADHLRRAMAVGVRDVLSPEARKSEIRRVVRRSIDAGERLRSARAASAMGPARRFIVVVSAKGGAGKTVISSNLAILIAQGSPRRTVLVDLDLQFGDVATALLLSPTYTLVDAVAAGDSLDLSTLKVFLTPHSESGLHVLCASDDPALGEALAVPRIGGVLDLLADEFAQVVVDTDPGLSEATLAALERATDIVVVADLDVPSVRGTRKLLDTLTVIGLGDTRQHIVLNRSNSRVGLNAADVAAAIGTHIDFALPSTRTVPISMNEGRPIVLGESRSPFSRAMTPIAAALQTDLAHQGATR
jgi:pilus assembly protein CpaE